MRSLPTVQRRQRGDTLVEVTIALAILAVVLLSAFNLASFSFRLGQIAKERTQAMQLAQEQAEALRSFRDNQSWAQFDAAAVGTTFHFTQVSGAWVLSSGEYAPVLNGAPTPYQVSITRQPNIVISAGPPQVTVNSYLITARWAPLGGQVCEANQAGDPECTAKIITNLGQTDDLRPEEN